jgi:hypothetical protein
MRLEEAPRGVSWMTQVVQNPTGYVLYDVGASNSPGEHARLLKIKAGYISRNSIPASSRAHIRCLGRVASAYPIRIASLRNKSAALEGIT